jgi:rRNA-processing protein FCF1
LGEVVRPFLILDACVLIDFYESDLSVLGAVARAIGPVCVASPILAEVEGLDASAAASAGITVVEPTLTMFASAAQKRGRLSVNDHLCLLLTQSESWTCVSNDKALRKACGEEDVAVMWGLEMMGQAVRLGALSSNDARIVAIRIAEVNPLITKGLLHAFFEKYLGLD